MALKLTNVFLIDGVYVIAPNMKVAFDIYAERYPQENISKIELINKNTLALIKE